MQNAGPDVSGRRRKPNGQFDNEFATRKKSADPFAQMSEENTGTPERKRGTVLTERETWQTLMSPTSSEEQLSQLYDSKKYEVRTWLAAHPNTSDEKLLELANAGKPLSVYEKLAHRSSLPSAAQLAFYQREPSLMFVQARFPIDQEILRMAIRDHDADMLSSAFSSQQCDTKTYELLAKRVHDENMPRSILVNQARCPSEEVESIVASVTDGDRYGYECITLYKAANNPNLSYLAAMTMLDKAFAHKDTLLAKRVAEHESDVVSAAALERSKITVYVEMRKAIDRGVARHRSQEENR